MNQNLSDNLSYQKLTTGYSNTAEKNDALFELLTKATASNKLLNVHRSHVEQHKLGFGERAFHAMWQVLLSEAAHRFGDVRGLEIGVYKGQVISLWSLLAREEKINLEVSAITPLAGNAAPRSRIWRAIRKRLDSRFREQINNGNFYDEEDYEQCVRSLFSHFGMDFSDVRLYRGYSNDPALLSQIEGQKFHLIYVDGDHTYEGSLADFRNFADKVVPGGWLVADDAGGNLPGTRFWKGHPAVTKAVESLSSKEFKNVLNVGHNRIFEKAGF